MSVRIRGRQAVLLLGPLVRAVPWWPVVAASGLAVAAVLPALLGAAAPAAPVWGLRIAALLLGAGSSFALVDAMAPLTVTATPRWLRQWLRFTIALLPAAAVWAALCRLAVGAAPSLPVGDLVGEGLVCALCGMAAAAVAARVGHTMTTALAGPATQAALVVATLFLSGGRSPWQLPASENWADIHLAWWVTVPVLAAVLLLANREVWPLLRRRRDS